MLEIQNVRKVNDFEKNIRKRVTKKTQIFLYDTGRRYGDYLNMLKYRRNGEYNDIPHYIITKTGDLISLFDTKYSSHTFGVKKIDNQLIKICLENLGWLTKNTINGTLFNWVGDPFRSEPYTKKWRGYYFWDTYTDKQYNTLVRVVKDLCEHHSIPYLSVPSQSYMNNVIKFRGIVCKSNFMDIYTDINPSFNFKIFINDEIEHI